MKDAKELAWRMYPKPNGINYTIEDLSLEDKVIELFEYCQILQAAIWSNCWKFLFEKYNLKGLLEIDKKSQWLFTEDKGDWIKRIIYHSLISGYNPISNQLGKYNDETGTFINTNQQETEIDWSEIYNMKNHL